MAQKIILTINLRNSEGRNDKGPGNRSRPFILFFRLFAYYQENGILGNAGTRLKINGLNRP